MSTSKLVPNDPQVKYESTEINGKKYSYMLGEPSGPSKGVVVLVHGFPDMGFGWRAQIPFFMARGYRVVVPDMLGYGGTDAPASFEEYTMKKLSADINVLSRKFVGEDGQIILGGHDWGGALIWRVALWYPELIKAVFSVCTPYDAPKPKFISLENALAAGKVPSFRYQLDFKGPRVEAHVQGSERVRQFLNGLYGGRGPNGETAFKPMEGVLFDNLSKLNPGPLLSKEELDFYVDQYMLHPAPQMRGPLNWYRTRELNFEDEKELVATRTRIEAPALFIAAKKDTALLPSMSEGMEKHFRSLSRGEVDASHWALTQAPGEVNERIGLWLDDLEGGKLKASL